MHQPPQDLAWNKAFGAFTREGLSLKTFRTPPKLLSPVLPRTGATKRGTTHQPWPILSLYLLHFAHLRNNGPPQAATAAGWQVRGSQGKGDCVGCAGGKRGSALCSLDKKDQGPVPHASQLSAMLQSHGTQATHLTLGSKDQGLSLFYHLHIPTQAHPTMNPPSTLDNGGLLLPQCPCH